MPNRPYIARSGNVFADLGLPKPDHLLAKAGLAARIIAEIQRRRLTQTQAATLLGIDQPKISALKQGKLSAFSIERPPSRCLNTLAVTAPNKIFRQSDR